MKRIIYCIIISLLLVSCKQDIPFPDGVEDGYRINKVETYNIDTITGDTLHRRSFESKYDNKNRVRKIDLFWEREFNRTLDFDYPNSKQLSFRVSPTPFPGYIYNTIIGRVMYNKDYLVESIQHKYKNEYGAIGGWLSRDFKMGSDNKLDSSYYDLLNTSYPNPDNYYYQTSFNGNNIIYYADNPHEGIYLSIPITGGKLRKQVALTYQIIPNATYNNYQLINIDDNFMMEGVWDTYDFYYFKENKLTYSLTDMYNTVQYFLPSFNWTGCGQDALVSTRTITGQTTYENNVVEPYYQYNTYEYEADGMGRVTKKIRKTGAGVVDRVWYFWYE